MSFFKDYPNRKDWRLKRKYRWKPYHHATSCTNNHGCPWCEGNRLHSIKIKQDTAEYSLKEYYKGE